MEEKSWKKIELIQRSPEWYEFRRTHIGASDGPIICGMSPYKSAHALWLEKTGQVEAKDISKEFHVAKGIRLEKMILGKCSIFLDRDFNDGVFESIKEPHISASLDGFCDIRHDLLEIKTGAKKDHEKLFESEESTPQKIIVPKKYYAQLQQQMFVMGADTMWYASYYLPKGTEDQDGSLRIVKVYLDESFIIKYTNILDEFYECIKSCSPPPIVNIEI